MDPNAALESILHGHLIADHTEALLGWLRGHGFTPLVLMPVDKAPEFVAPLAAAFGADWAPIEVTATVGGIFARLFAPVAASRDSAEPLSEDWKLLMTWDAVTRIPDGE